MRNIVRFSNRLALLVGYIAIVYLVFGAIQESLRPGPRLDPYEAVGLGAIETLAEHHTPRNPNGDGSSMIVWKLAASPEAIVMTVDGVRIERGRIWFPAPFGERGEMSFAWLSNSEAYRHVKEYVDQFGGRSFYYTFDRFRGNEDGMLNCALWMVLPDAQLLAYLNIDT
jgi:hypothetical protein